MLRLQYSRNVRQLQIQECYLKTWQKMGPSFKKDIKKTLCQNIEEIVTLKRRFQSRPSANRNTVWTAPFHNEANSRNKFLVVASDARKQSGGIFSIVNPYLYTNKTISRLLLIFGITCSECFKFPVFHKHIWLLTFQVGWGYGAVHSTDWFVL